METFRHIVIIVSVIPFIGGAIYTIASMFYTVPKMFEGRFLSRADVRDAIPKPLRRFGNICVAVFLGCLAFALVVEFCANLFRTSSK